MAEVNAGAIADIWARTTNQVKQNVISPPLWRALSQTVAVTWEGDNFVIGFTNFDGTAAGQLNSTQYRAEIERLLRSFTGSPNLRLRVIEGSDIADWEHLKQRDAAAAVQQAEQFQKRTVEASAFGTWDEVYDQISRLWASSEHRSLPTGRARYLRRALVMLTKAMDGGLYPPEGTDVDEPTERGLARVIDRIASLSNTDAVIVAHLLLDLRDAVKG